jgi:hypothetical protein
MKLELTRYVLFVGALRERRYSPHLPLTSALERSEWLAARPAAFTTGKVTGTHFTGGCVGPTAGLDTETGGKILYLRRGWNTFRPVRSQSLY